ncbi:MAG: ATP-dependent zinc protease [Rickettsiaceae bacterium]
MTKEPVLIGWREWAQLPDLNVPLIKAKIDTGAKTSALHAYDIEVIEIKGKKFADFVIHPIQNNDEICIKSRAEVVDMRTVKSSNGHKQLRLVIRSLIQIGEYKSSIDITLTNRDIMHHRMLLGRTAMKDVLINPSESYCQGRVSKNEVLNTYSIS